ncbi:MAG: phosphoribosylformylglycinamidine synthase subunit PurL [Chloroflexi bacterium]|nr:phosphoribosylformylglycinamidine synthase subunit PurL [Chloroflexota bacterium]
MPASQETLDTIALTRAEYDLIVQKLEREPNEVELGLFGALWSEHCGYKHSKPLLRTFPTTGAAVQVEAGQENAGVVDIGDGLSVVFKAESHNHPSAVEPYQGAATGVGGIIRDILAMGARPIALLNSLRFGPLSDPRNRYLFDGVVRGISGYGNCIGIPDVGGEIQFADVYSGNPLVNAMCIGLLREGELMSAAAKTPGSVLVAVGSATGRDGIHGASGLASRTFGDDDDREMRPTVQVGDPFLEKVLVEACLEAAKSGHLEGLQDMGAAGLTSSAIECAERGGTGLELNVDAVPRREEGMTAYDVMLSESQERMLLIVKEGHEDAIAEIFERWDLHASNIGTVTDDGIVRIFEGGKCVAEVDVQTLVAAPQYRPGGTRPAYLDGLHAHKLPVAPDPSRAGELLLSLLASPNIASRRAVYRQYDHEVQTNTLAKPGAGDAAVVRIRGTKKAIAIAIDGNGRQAYLEPYVGGAMAVAEACRNVVCAGGRPLAITDCLNFGDPTKPEVYYQLEEAIKGMTAACEALGVPVISGNVSLFNESGGTSIYPTPVVGAVGLLDDATTKLTAEFKNEGDLVLLLGTPDSGLAASEYLSHIHGLVIGQPTIDLDAEARLQSLAVALADQRLLRSAHDCSDGGLTVAIAESAILGGLGYTDAGLITLMTLAQKPTPRWDASLFGESPSRIVVTCAPANLDTITERARESGVALIRLGTVASDRFTIAGFMDLPLAELADAHGNGLELALQG